MSQNKEKPSQIGGAYWLYGRHAALAALGNPMRKIRRILATGQGTELLSSGGQARVEAVDAKVLEQAVGPDAVHQGLAVLVEPLATVELEEVTASGKPLLILDQVTDPQNVGAILRSAAAFDAAAVIFPRDHAAKESGALAKAASGALEMIPLVEVTNLARAIEEIKKAGYWVAGLDGEAKQTIAEAKLTRKTALVLGAEGKGLRRLTAEHCDLLVRLPIHPQMESLNVSNAAAVALYALNR